MFDNIKINRFYNKLKNGKFVNNDYFDIIPNDLKMKIISDNRFAQYIDISLIIKKNPNNKEQSYFIDEKFLSNLNDNDLKTIIFKIITNKNSLKLDLSNLFIFLKERLLVTQDIDLKEKISELLYVTVKESFLSKTDYINKFISLFNTQERIQLLEINEITKFLTFHSKNTDEYYGYDNFFKNIIDESYSQDLKFELTQKIFEFMPKSLQIKTLYIKLIEEQLNTENIVNILNTDEFIELYKYDNNALTFNYDSLLNILNRIEDTNLQKQIINNYFTGFDNNYIENIIDSRNKINNPKNNISGSTILSLYELGFINNNIDDVMIKYCKDKTLFDFISRYDNKEKVLLKISSDIDCNLMLSFASKYNINIFNQSFAQKFCYNDSYFKILPDENCDLIQYYNGNNGNVYYNKLEKCENKDLILRNSNFKFEIKELMEFSKKHNVDIYFSKMIDLFSSSDIYFESLPEEKNHLIKNYTGKNIDLFIDKISKCNNKLEILFFNNLNVESDNIYKVVIDKGILNDKEKQLVSELLDLKDDKLRTVYKNYVLKNYDSIPTEKINIISDLLFRISITNSEEILNFRSEIANQLLETDNPIDNFKNIEELFIKNNLPIIGKLYSVFDILHPEFKDFDFDNDKISPALKNKSTRGRKVTVFSDLLKSSLGSNNRSIREYLYNLETGEKIYKSIINNEVTLDKLDYNDSQTLKSFINNLITLYNTSNKGNNIHLTNNLKQDIILISDLFKESNNLSNKIVRMFGYFSGFNNIEEIKRYIEIKTLKTTTKNYKTANEPFKLEVGDYIKGIGSIDYLSNILQNGSLAREFLGSYSSSDLTPLDTDISKILDIKDNLYETINATTSKTYGPIWFVLKNDDRFFLSRTSDSVENIENNGNKLEVFYTGIIGKDHYGIRTGFASSEIDYIISKDNDPRIGLEIALNGFYIPVVDINGNLIFTPNDYENLREKMSGLKHYGLGDYKFSNNLHSPGIDEILGSIINDVSEEKNIINKHIEKVISKLDLKLKTNSDGDLTPGSVEFIDTGSTGRKTNLPGKSDFDFMMRLDNSLLYDKEKLEDFKNNIIKSFVSIESKVITSTGDFRLQGVQIEGLSESIDLDISFTQKTSKVSYSTDSSIKDRLDTIKKQDPTKYELVIGNILLAKKFLKESGVYKPKHSRLNPEGGLGGVGIENWILQNGGSFIDACNDFINGSKNKSFDEFSKTYQIWDFGENYLSGNNNRYSHDNFVNNISEEGYNKLKEVLTSYVNDNVVNTNYNKKTN